jgi:uncharacterized protein (TIGR02001 family)
MPKGSHDGRIVSWRRITCTALLAAAAQACPWTAAASEWSGIGTLTSEYIYRGQSVSDGDPAVQFGIDFEHDSGVFAGLWASTIDLQNNFGERDTELDFYIGYRYALQAPVILTATLIRYTYPGQKSVFNYDYNEALVTATLHDRHSVEFGYTSDLYGLGRIGRHWEIRSEWPNASAWVITAGLGRNDLTGFGGSRYLYWDLGASVRFSRLTADFRWYDNEQPDSSIGGVSADSQFVISLSAAF